jgi:hypothetical protein
MVGGEDTFAVADHLAAGASVHTPNCDADHCQRLSRCIERHSTERSKSQWRFRVGAMRE